MNASFRNILAWALAALIAFFPSVTFAQIPQPTIHPINLSCRVMISPEFPYAFFGFVVDGTGERKVLIRAIGPGLARFGIENPNPDPQLVLDSKDGRIADNDDWSRQVRYSNGASTGYTAEEIRAIGIRAGAFPLEPGSKDAATIATLSPGNYSLGVGGYTRGLPGEVLVEVYFLP